MPAVSSLVSFVGGSERTVAITNTVNTQATAIANQTLTGGLNFVTTMAASSMAALPLLPAGSIVVVTSSVATNTLALFPPVGGTITAINAAGTINASVLMAAQGQAVFIATGGGPTNSDFHRIV